MLYPELGELNLFLLIDHGTTVPCLRLKRKSLLTLKTGD